MKKLRLTDGYLSPGYRPQQRIIGIASDPQARVIVLKRTKKKQHVGNAAGAIAASMIGRCSEHGIFPAETCWSILNMNEDASCAERPKK